MGLRPYEVDINRAYRCQLRVPGGPPYWVRIRTTSDDLVPSMELTRQNPETHGLESFAWCRPRDFAVFPLRLGPIVPRPGGEIEPGEVGPIFDE